LISPYEWIFLLLITGYNLRFLLARGQAHELEGNRAGKPSQPSQEHTPVTLGMERGMLTYLR
jgi:hypothetical protein